MEYNKTGCRLDPWDHRDRIYKVQKDNYFKKLFNNEKKKVDNSYLAATKNQGPEGTCVSFATGTGFELSTLKLYNKKIDISERYLNEAAKIYDPFPGENYDGTTIKAAMKVLQRIGVCTGDKWEYIPNNKLGYIFSNLPSSVHVLARENRILNYHTCFGSFGSIDLERTRIAIDNFGCVVAGFQLPKNFGDRIHYSKEQDFDKVAFHAMLICGYDDFKQEVVVVNSWGAGFGLGGRCYFSYKALKKFVFAAYAFSI